MEGTDIIKALGAIKTSIDLLKALNDFWSKIASNEDFDQALFNTLVSVDRHYGSEIFGGDIQQVFKNPELKSHLREILFAYGEIDQHVLSQYIDLETLPEDFFEIFMSIYFEELTKYDELRKSISDWQQSQDLINIKEGVGKVSEELQSLKGILGKLLVQNNTLAEVKPIRYSSVTGYLERSVVSFREYTSTNLGDDYSRKRFLDTSSKTLFESLCLHGKIVLLGVGGFGKSIELKHLAHQISEDNNSYPFLIKLDSYSSERIEELLQSECENWNQIPEEKINLIFDGLDEIHTNEIDHFIRKLNRFSKSHEHIKIVVSCRNNQYVLDDNGFGPLDQFEVYSLAPLQYAEIKTYLSEQLKESDEIYFTKIWERNLYDLIQSPFYLVKITRLYIDNGYLPNRRSDLFEHLTNEKIKSDFKKFKISGIDLRAYNSRIKKEIYRIAFVCQCLDKGVLDELTELQEIVTDEQILRRVQFSFLFNRGDDNKWEFEHNNFREYFAAIFLGFKGLEFIKKLIAFPPSFSMVKPQWVNTLTFLVSILDKESRLCKDLLEWLVEIEPDLLFRMEKEKLDLTLRLKIAHDIVEKYESRELWLRSEKFTTADIASFIAGSSETFHWVSNRLKSKDNRVIFHTVEILDNLKVDKNQKLQLIALLHKSLENVGLDEYTCYRTVKLLVRFGMKDESVLTILQSKPDYANCQYIRAACYYFIRLNGLADKYITLLIDGIPLQKELGVLKNTRVRTRKVYTQTETENLEKAISSIKEKASLIQLINWAIECLNDTPKLKAESIIELIAEKCKDFNLGDIDLFVLFINFLTEAERCYQREVEKILINIAKESGLKHRVFKELFTECSSREDRQYWLLPKLADIEEASLVFKCYASGEVSDDFIRGFRNLLGGQNQDVHDWFHTRINEYSGDQFLYAPIEPSWDEQMKIKHREDLYYLFDKQALIKRAQGIFDAHDKSNLKKKDMARRIARDTLNSDLKENLALDILRDLSHNNEEDVSMCDFLDFVNDEDRWRWYKVSTIISKETHHQVILSETEIAYLKKWTDGVLSDCDFKTALTMSDDTYYYRNLEMFIAYLVRSHGFEIANHLKLDFLHMASNIVLIRKRLANEDEGESDVAQELILWVESQCGGASTKQKVLEILKADAPDSVISSLASFCARRKIVECLPSFLSLIQNKSCRDHPRNELLDHYVDLNGEPARIVDVIDQFSFNSKVHALDLLNNVEYSGVEKLCLRFLSKEDDLDKQLELIFKMIRFSHRSGYRELAHWVDLHKTLPMSNRFHISMEPSEDLPNDVYQYFIQIYETAVENDFGDWDHEGRRSYLDVILKAGTQSEDAYMTVRDKFNQWMNKYEIHSFMYFKIEELDKLYFQKANPAISFDEVLDLLSD